jgi:hypothetical protein
MLARPHPDQEKIRNGLAALKDVPTILGSGAPTFDDNRNPTYGPADVGQQRQSAPLRGDDRPSFGR